jgi:hypothetical protein
MRRLNLKEIVGKDWLGLNKLNTFRLIKASNPLWKGVDEVGEGNDVILQVKKHNQKIYCYVLENYQCLISSFAGSCNDTRSTLSSAHDIFFSG